MTVAPETASVTPTDSLVARWRYLPKLIGILWKLAPWEMAFVGAGSLVSGLVPIGAVLVLRGLVDSVADLISGEGDLSSALVWVGALLAVSLLENALYEAQDWLARGVRDRMVVRIEERLLRKASALSLSAFERPDLYDQMHRARQALDTRLYTESLLPVQDSVDPRHGGCRACIPGHSAHRLSFGLDRRNYPVSLRHVGPFQKGLDPDPSTDIVGACLGIPGRPDDQEGSGIRGASVRPWKLPSRKATATVVAASPREVRSI